MNTARNAIYREPAPRHLNSDAVFCPGAPTPALSLLHRAEEPGTANVRHLRYRADKLRQPSQAKGSATQAAQGDPMAIADLSPNLVRATLETAMRHGIAAERLCRGLGFRAEDLMRIPEAKLSYRQTSQLVKRFKDALGDKASGLAVGAIQTPLSLGLPGIGMLTCRTVGEAVYYCLEHQRDAGAVVTHQVTLQGRSFSIELLHKFPDLDLQPFFVEEGFASIVAIGRALIGPHFRPEKVELAYPRPHNGAEYLSTFNCPVSFSAERNRVVFDVQWLGHEMRTYDSLTCDLIRKQLDQLLGKRNQQSDFLESVSAYLRANLHQPVALADVARELNLSERTASRRLGEHGVTFQQVLDRVRLDHAEGLLAQTSMSIEAIATAVGFMDPSNFRRAYKRWTGRLPRK